MPERRQCPECGRKLDGLMSEGQLPGLVAIIRGDTGSLARWLLLIGICTLAVLILTGAALAIGGIR